MTGFFLDRLLFLLHLVGFENLFSSPEPQGRTSNSEDKILLVELEEGRDQDDGDEDLPENKEAKAKAAKTIAPIAKKLLILK